MKSGIELITIERQEQIEKHGRTIQRDIDNNSGKYEIDGEQFNEPQLPHGAQLLLYPDHEELIRPHLLNANVVFIPYGWDKEIWLKMVNKPYKERLIIAGALIAAEIDRLQNLKQ